MRRIVFHQPDGAEIVDVLGFDFNVVTALRKYYNDDKTLLEIFLVIDNQRKGLHDIGGELVDNHLKRRMQVFIGNRDTGTSIEFI